MAKHRLAWIVALLSPVLLGACATAPSTSRYAYYRVPCTTPGAVAAEPIAIVPPGQSAGIPAPEQAGAHSPEARGDAPPTSAASPTCVIAVAQNGYGRGYYPWPGYRRPYYGSFGLGFGIGSFGHGHHGGHGGGGHHVGGHGGGHH